MIESKIMDTAGIVHIYCPVCKSRLFDASRRVIANIGVERYKKDDLFMKCHKCKEQIGITFTSI